MNTYGLTLGTCEGLIWAVRQERALWNAAWGKREGRGDGCCCVVGAYARHIGCQSLIWDRYGYLDLSYEDPQVIKFAESWFYGMAKKAGSKPVIDGPYGEPVVILKWIVLGKLRLIHDHLADEAEQREGISRWAPAVVEVPSQKEVAPCGS